MATAKSSSTANLGKTILMIGTIAQVGSYLLFVFLITYTHKKLRGDKTVTWPGFPWVIFWVIYFSSIFILVSAAHFYLSLLCG